ncbi:MAG: P-loop NTPase fold protein [Massilibacteroides sp.]|jgi:hypothetical protein|nr:P-loop NTPase fold protein [Massilibacteroides sp.]
MWADNETNQDLLGYQVHADLLKKIILKDTMLPISIGVFGNWGSGKSSLMLLLEEGIKDWIKENKENNQLNTKILQVKFNSWQFENYDSTKLTMIESILEALSKDIKSRMDIFEKADDLIARISLMESGVFILKKIANILPENIKNFLPNKAELDKICGKDKYNNLIDSISKGNTSKFIQEFRSMFENLVLDAKYKAVVVYIDDLDRCDPKRIIDCLEAVKLFVNVKKTAFVIGADERIIEYAIKLHYPIEQKKEEISSPFSDYLEKLIQLPYKIPRLSDNEQETYITLLLCRESLNDISFNSLHEKYIGFRNSDKHSKYNIDDIKQALPNINLSSVEYMLPVVPLMKNFLNGNPRQLKRFMNTLDVRLQLADVAGFSDIRPDVLVKLMVLEYNILYASRFEDIYKRQREGKGYVDFSQLKEQAQLEKKFEDSQWGSSWDSDYLRRWATSEPMLDNVNLQNYFWVARDALKKEVPLASVVTNKVMLFYKGLTSCQTISTIKKRLPDVINKMEDNEIDMLIMLINQSLKSNPSDKNSWIILNGDEDNLLINNQIDRMKALFEGIAINNIDSLADSFFVRTKKLGDNFSDYINHLNLNSKLTKAISRKEN